MMMAGTYKDAADDFIHKTESIIIVSRCLTWDPLGEFFGETVEGIRHAGTNKGRDRTELQAG